jgi:archaemetzincin
MKKCIGLFIIFIAVVCYIFIGCNSSSSTVKPFADKEKVIGIQPYENFDLDLADTVSQQIQLAYGIKTIVLKPVPLPKEAYTTIRSPRYRADSLLRHLHRIRPDSLYIIMGLTDHDISITKFVGGKIKEPKSKYIDFGIFGLGALPGPACIVSTYRYKKTEKTLFYDRFFKISKHEIGHNLGLPHCANKTCIMQDAAESIQTIDRSGEFLCTDCKRKMIR